MLTDITVLILNIIEKWGVQGILGIVLVFLAYRWINSGNMYFIFLFFSGIRKKNRLKHIMNETHTSPETYARVLLELRQQDNMWLTGMQTPTLANIAMELTKQNNLRARYFYNWRRWLTENKGVVVFDEKKYNNARKEHYVMSFIGLLNALIISLEIYLRFKLSLVYMPYVVFVNIFIFMGVMVFISWVPGMELTVKMKSYIEKYNSVLLSELSKKPDETSLN
ncbi:TPA: hypothetical protein ACGQML_004509 [Escherichia coli]|uniref:hypothetical protein n=1 Tax=Escherichia coli TaxID=562 RepID=UPI000B7F636E|nr:hypothetical protein [Escherichia coli]